MSVLDRWTAEWAHCVWVAAWQGTLFAAVAWAICRLWRDMPARGRAWLWFLVSVKFIAGFLPFRGIPLPILPNSGLSLSLTGLHLPVRVMVQRGVSLECASVSCASYVHSPDFVQCAHVAGLILRVPLMLLWVYGVGVCFFKMAHGWWHALQLRSRAVPVTQPAISFECRRLCFFVGIRPPMLLESDELTSPIVTGFVLPAIILPSDMIVNCKVQDARMMLAHELGHLKRRDLLFGWAPAVAQLLNWWNPVLWMISREWSLAQEIACDELAVETTAALPSHFGQMLLSIAMASRRPQATGVAAVGLAGELLTLKKRLIGMRDIGRRRRRTVNFTMRAVLCAASLLIPTWSPAPASTVHVPIRSAVVAWQGAVSVARTVDARFSLLRCRRIPQRPVVSAASASLVEPSTAPPVWNAEAVRSDDVARPLLRGMPAAPASSAGILHGSSENIPLIPKASDFDMEIRTIGSSHPRL